MTDNGIPQGQAAIADSISAKTAASAHFWAAWSSQNGEPDPVKLAALQPESAPVDPFAVVLAGIEALEAKLASPKTEGEN